MVGYGGVLRVLVVGCLACALSTFVLAQAPAGRDVTTQTRVHADMLQVMRAVLYPAANVIFTAQSEDPEAFEPAARMSTSPNPFTAAYGGWMAVELSGLALAESANLLTIPGRLCGNGRPCSRAERRLAAVGPRAPRRWDGCLRGRADQESGRDSRCGGRRLGFVPELPPEVPPGSWRLRQPLPY